MRMLVIKTDTDLQALSSRLLTAGLSSTQAKSALERLQALNPHIDPRYLRAGTIILVPDASSFDASVTESVSGETFKDVEQTVKRALDAAAEHLKAANTARARDREEVIEAIKQPAVKGIIDADAQLKQQVTDATKGFEEEQQQAEQAEQELAAASKAALAKLAELSKVLG